jgi:hypothetical protein
MSTSKNILLLKRWTSTPKALSKGGKNWQTRFAAKAAR